MCRIVGSIRFFYFLDPYGVQPEFEQGHPDTDQNSVTIDDQELYALLYNGINWSNPNQLQQEQMVEL